MKQLVKILVIIVSLTGCEAILDCVLNVVPELPDKTFKVGHVDEFYYDDLLAGINNQPRDDDYDYYFDFPDNLPEGLIVYNDFRTVRFEGTPVTQGTYNFTINLKVKYKYPSYNIVDDTYDDGNLCLDETSNTYTIIIN